MDVMLPKDDFTKVTFTPPLYKQRYHFIKQLVSEHKPKKVADLGCADCKLVWMLKFCNCIEVLVGVDISEEVMKEKMHTLSPLPVDYLQPSERSLTVILYQGSVAHKDPCMLGFDMITCIELIEHLEANELETFPEVVFGFMSPTMVVISTPNSEFNPLLQTVTLFRHPDHKFEWNRAQFQNWAQEIAARYDYVVEFTGLGVPPPGKDVGFCTQIGVFVRKSLKHVQPNICEKHQDHVYKTVFKVEYPSLKEEKYLRTAVVNEVHRTADIIARRLWDHRWSQYKKHCNDPVETEPQFQSHPCFQKYLEYCSMPEPDSASIQPFMNGNIAHIPLAKIFSFPKVKQLCGNYETLMRFVAGQIALSSDESAVVINTEYEDDEQKDLRDMF
ncbi:small RNA 2'-O-methyltransferase [Anolis sagrei]|uniref:small RNA 2'-O-methyltransferase n=1 Tax=Anolis sagrei TaxID=38937 RepID=UPI0035208A11